MELSYLVSEISDLISSELGRFKSSDSFWNNRVSIYVEPPQVPAAVRCEGLQCIIQRSPLGFPENASSKQKHFDRIWVVRLVNFDPNSIQLSSAADKIQRRFNIRRYVYIPATEMTREAAEIQIYDPGLVAAIGG